MQQLHNTVGSGVTSRALKMSSALYQLEDDAARWIDQKGGPISADPAAMERLRKLCIMASSVHS